MSSLLLWLLFTLACTSATDILVRGVIFAPLRSWVFAWWHHKVGPYWVPFRVKNTARKMVGCSMCMGFHVGWFMYLLFHMCGHVLLAPIPLGMFVAALVSSRLSYISTQSFDDDGFRFFRREIKK